MTLVLHGPSYNPSFPKIAPEALAADINNELITYWLPLTGGTVTGPTTFNASLIWTTTGATTPRAAQDRTADWVNVKDYGAVLNGSTVDTAAFNAAVAAVPSLGTIFIPSGGFNYTGGTAAFSTKPILWQLTGNNFGTGTTPVNGIGNGLVETFLNTTTKFFSRGSTLSTSGGTTPTPNIGPVVRIDSLVNHNGGPSGGIPGLFVSVSNSAASNPNVAPYGIVGQVTLNSTASVVSGATGVAGYGARAAGAGPACPFGANFYGEDRNLTSSGITGSLVGAEIDLHANRLDDGTLADGRTFNPAATYPGVNRILLDLKYQRWNQSDNNPMEIGAIINLGLGDATNDLAWCSAKMGLNLAHKITWAGVNMHRAVFVGNANAILLPTEARIAWSPDDPNSGSVPTHFSYLQYRTATSRLYYVVDGVDQWSVDASGNMRARGTVTGSTTP